MIEVREERQSAYGSLIESIFDSHYTPGAEEIEFDRGELISTAAKLGVRLPKNLGDVLYTFRYRRGLPESIRRHAPSGKEWIIRPAGHGRYRFAAIAPMPILPNPLMAETKIPDATPGIIARYALSDEQALLAKLRYNKLVDIFTGVACYSLQSHLRTSIAGMGQVETHEIYVGVDKRGVQYVFPVQAKGGRDAQSIVQIEQDVAVCQNKFPDLVCRPIAAQFMSAGLIALFEFETGGDGLALVSEKHYLLVAPASITAEDLAAYRLRLS